MEAWLDSFASWHGLLATGLFLSLACVERWRGADVSTTRLAANLGSWLLGAWLVSWLPVGWSGALNDVVHPFRWLQNTTGDWVVLLVGMLTLDLFAYASHRLHHVLHPLWRLHACHHSDPTVDASTALRHHPGEALSVALLGGALFGFLGLPVWVMATGALLTVAWALVQHADLPWVPAVERGLGWLLITPGLHRVHHSEDERHYGTNFGAVLSVWDRLFGTLMLPPKQSLRYGIGLDGVGSEGPAGAFMLPLRLGRGDPRVDAG